MSAVYLWAAFEHPFLSPMNAGLGMSHINFNRNILGSIMDPASLAIDSQIRFAGQVKKKSIRAMG